MAKDQSLGLSVKKENFSEWYSEIIAKAELADLRYNVKGFLVHRPMSVIAMKEMYKLYEKELEKYGHLPVLFPAVIPESNFKLEGEHVKGFTPEVFWVTETGNGEKLSEKVALRPTSETAMYKMYSIWIRSYKDLPLKLYQSCQVWRYETKATRPFIRGREFYWIEGHNAFATREEAENQVLEDMQITKNVLFNEFGIPFLFLKRPEWDKFAGAVYTCAADCLMPDGKVLQQPSTHFFGQNFSKPFNIKFKDNTQNDQFAWQTAYGPAIWRMFASVIAVHGDDKGLVFPFKIAPIQVVIIPISNDPKLIKKCQKLEKKLKEKDIRVNIDNSDNSVGWRFNEWELKGVPIRIEVGKKEMDSKIITLSRRDTNEKIKVNDKNSIKKILSIGNDISEHLKFKAEKNFNENIKTSKTYEELKKNIEKGGLIKANFCSMEKDGKHCADKIKEDMVGTVRGIRIDIKEVSSGKCIVCGKESKHVVYIARQY